MRIPSTVVDERDMTLRLPVPFGRGTIMVGLGVVPDYVQAHMWFNIAAAQGNETARRFRDDLAPLMTPAQTAEAHRLARQWRPE